MIHKRFTSTRKHGAVYDIEDFMAVTILNDELCNFMSRWDSVITGKTSEPGVMWKTSECHNALKKFKPMIVLRWGNPTALIIFSKAARDYLERKGLEKMRQATKKSLSGKKDAIAAASRLSSASKCAGTCYDFQAGSWTGGGDSKCKHEKAIEVKFKSYKAFHISWV